MSSKYPSAIDDSISLPIATDNVSPVKSDFVNNLRNAILAIESELGIDPSREYGTVRARLDALSAGGGGGGSIGILQDGIQILPSAIELDFVGNVDVTISQPLRARIEVIGGQASQVQETIPVTSDGQTHFSLSQTPLQVTAVLMFANGIKQEYGTDYFVVGSSVTYIGSVFLFAGDKVEFWYLIDLGGISDTASAIDTKIRVYATTNQPSAAVTVNKTAVWDAISSLVIPANIDVVSNTTLVPSLNRTFICQGQLTIAAVVAAATELTVEVILNDSTVVHTIITDFGVGITRSLPFAFVIDLAAGDELKVRWRHDGDLASTTQLLGNDGFSWFGLSEL